MERATAPQIRKSLELADGLKRAGVRFVPMPIIDDSDAVELYKEMNRRLDILVGATQDEPLGACGSCGGGDWRGMRDNERGVIAYACKCGHSWERAV